MVAQSRHLQQLPRRAAEWYMHNTLDAMQRAANQPALRQHNVNGTVHGATSTTWQLQLANDRVQRSSVTNHRVQLMCSNTVLSAQLQTEAQHPKHRPWRLPGSMQQLHKTITPGQGNDARGCQH